MGSRFPRKTKGSFLALCIRDAVRPSQTLRAQAAPVPSGHCTHDAQISPTRGSRHAKPDGTQLDGRRSDAHCTRSSRRWGVEPLPPSTPSPPPTAGVCPLTLPCPVQNSHNPHGLTSPHSVCCKPNIHTGFSI